MASLIAKLRKWLGIGKTTQPFSVPKRRKMFRTGPAFGSRPKARNPPTRSCARGEEPKAVEFDCGASSCWIDRVEAIRVPQVPELTHLHIIAREVSGYRTGSGLGRRRDLSCSAERVWECEV